MNIPLALSSSSLFYHIQLLKTKLNKIKVFSLAFTWPPNKKIDAWKYLLIANRVRGPFFKLRFYVLFFPVELWSNIVSLMFKDLKKYIMGAFLWDDPDQDQCSGSWRIKGTEESTLGKDFSVPLMCHDLSDLGSPILIWMIPMERTLYLWGSKVKKLSFLWG